jgi:anaerobic ribonucleoside-triphosphate reductase activating protein
MSRPAISGDARPAGAAVPVAAFLDRSRVSGPGLRSVLWVQGCPLRCPGCCNPDFLPFAGGVLTPSGELAERILAVPDTEGVTFSGGEPFAHARGLAEVARRVRAAGRNVVVFTGYTRAQLSAALDPGRQALLAQADLLVAGPYEAGRACNRGLLASANQELVFLTARCRPADCARAGRELEVHLLPDGEVLLTGLPG